MKIITIVVSILFIFEVNALTLKVGILAPDGTNWAKTVKKMSKEIKQVTSGKVKLKTYLGGSLGDEPVVLQKIRVGQVHGGLFTGKTLGEINGDVRILEVPFTFRKDRAKAWSTVLKMKTFLNKGFEKNGFVNLGFFEIGQVYLVSQKKIASLDGLKGVKIWSWTGDPVANALVNVMGLVAVPLALPDVLSSLSTGIIEAAYSPPIGITALQWNTKVKYFMEYPITFSVGAFLVNKKSWNKISNDNQRKIKEVCLKHITQANKNTIVDNQDAIDAMKMLGIEFVSFDKAGIAKSGDIRKKIISNLTGKVFSALAVKELEKNIK